jgi:hypothetical protein
MEKATEMQNGSKPKKEKRIFEKPYLKFYYGQWKRCHHF